MIRQMVVLLVVGGSLKFGNDVLAAVTITQGSAPGYATSLNFDEPGGPTGNGVPFDAWAGAPYFIGRLSSGPEPSFVGDNSAFTGEGTNSFFGSFGVSIQFANDVTELSLQAWNNSGPPDPTFGGGMVIVVINDGDISNPLALEVVTPAFGGAGEPMFSFTTTDGTVFDEVFLQGFSATPGVYVDNLSWNAVPEPSMAVWLSLLGIAGFQRRSAMSPRSFFRRSQSGPTKQRATRGHTTRQLRV